MQVPTPNIESKYIIFVLYFMISNRLQTIGDVFFKEVSTKQWFVLLVLCNIVNDHAPTLNELSAEVGSSHQNVKQLVLKLEHKGYVELKKDENDARRLRIILTPKSYEFQKLYEGKSEDFMNELFRGIDKKDMDATLKVMLTLKNHLERMEKDYVRE